jgi:hypothetical protein
MDEQTALINREPRNIRDFISRYISFTNLSFSVIATVFLITGNTIYLLTANDIEQYYSPTWIYLRSLQICYILIMRITDKHINIPIYSTIFITTETIGCILILVLGKTLIGAYNFIVMIAVLTCDATVFILYLLYYISGGSGVATYQVVPSTPSIPSVPSVVIKVDNVNEECIICLERYEEGGTIKVLKCTHRFHPECIDMWHSQKQSCPLCRTQST